MRRVRNRLYADLLMPDRLPEYRDMLQRALDQGYQVHSLRSWRRARAAGETRGVRSVILRRDVDTDPGTAGAQFEIEHALGVRASYFFRLRTLDVALMRSVAAAGHDVGYHFEEIATAAKRQRLRSRADVERELPRIRRCFAGNLERVRARSGLPIELIASHGDMANRRLGINNRALLTDELRTELAIEGEAYDKPYWAGVTTWISDAPYPSYWQPHHVDDAFERGDAAILLVTHPRHWRRNVGASVREDLRRAGDGVRYPRWSVRA